MQRPNTRQVTERPAAIAREAAGFTLEQAAKRGRVSVSYLRECERSGNFTLILAGRMMAVYGCGIDAFRRITPGNAERRMRAGAGRGDAARLPVAKPTKGKAA